MQVETSFSSQPQFSLASDIFTADSGVPGDPFQVDRSTDSSMMNTDNPFERLAAYVRSAYAQENAGNHHVHFGTAGSSMLLPLGFLPDDCFHPSQHQHHQFGELGSDDVAMSSYDAPSFGLGGLGQGAFHPDPRANRLPRLTIQIPGAEMDMPSDSVAATTGLLGTPTEDSHSSSDYHCSFDDDMSDESSTSSSRHQHTQPSSSTVATPSRSYSGSGGGLTVPRSSDKKRKSPDGDYDGGSSSYAPSSSSSSSSIVPLSPSWGQPQLRTRYTLGIVGLPVKSRVETQIKMCLKLAESDSATAASSPTSIPGHLTQAYNNIIVDSNLLAPAVGRRRAATVVSAEEESAAMQDSHLLLQCHIVASQDISKEVHRCSNCIQRERRNLKRKIKTDLPEELSPEQEKRKIIQFYTHKVVDFSAGEAVLPVRITCYCRHHKETTGFGIVVTLLDGATRQVVASTLSSWIMITDDHKSQNRPSKKPKRADEAHTPSSASHLTAGANSGSSNNNNYHGFSDADGGEPSDSSSATSSPLRVPVFGPLTSGTDFPNQQQFGGSASPMIQVSSPGVSPSMMTPQMPFVSHGDNHQHLGIPHHLPVASASPSSTSPYDSYSHSPMTTPPSPSHIKGVVEKAVPSEGPMSGGMEVTILGQYLMPVHRVFFGASQATILQYWGPNALVALLPASATPTTVPVFVLAPMENQLPSQFDQDLMGSFTYHDETDRQLLELALQILGMKLTGKLEDAKKIAMEIVARSRQQQQQSDASSRDGGSQGEGWPQHPFATFASGADAGTTTAPSSSVEELIVGTLMALHQGRLKDFVQSSSSSNSDNADAAAAAATPSHEDLLVDLSLPSATGHTLLHLAVLKNYRHLAEVLLALGKVHRDSYEMDVNAVDINGFTPLHFAVLTHSEEFVRLLRSYGADPTINDEQGRVPEELLLASAVAANSPLRRALLQQVPANEAAPEKTAQPLLAPPPSSSSTVPVQSPLPALPKPSLRQNEEDEPISPAPRSIADDDSDSDTDIAGGNNNDVELFMMDSDGEKALKNRTTGASMMLTWMTTTAQRIWAEYKFAFYISALIVCFTTMLIETLPYHFAVGVMREGSGLTTTNPSIISDKGNPKPYVPVPETSSQLWMLYFVLRLGLICAILTGLVVHYRPALERASPRFARAGFAAAVLTIVLVFLVGLMHIFGFLSLF